jgi:hypothetical protein
MLNSNLNFLNKSDRQNRTARYCLKIGEGIVSTLGNILTFIGKAKAESFFLITIAIAIVPSKDYVFGLFTSHFHKR